MEVMKSDLFSKIDGKIQGGEKNDLHTFLNRFR